MKRTLVRIINANCCTDLQEQVNHSIKEIEKNFVIVDIQLLERPKQDYDLIAMIRYEIEAYG